MLTLLPVRTHPGRMEMRDFLFPLLCTVCMWGICVSFLLGLFGGIRLPAAALFAVPASLLAGCLLAWGGVAAKRASRYRDAILKHWRMTRTDSCWENDRELHAVLGLEFSDPNEVLGDRAFLKRCEIYCQGRKLQGS